MIQDFDWELEPNWDSCYPVSAEVEDQIQASLTDHAAIARFAQQERTRLETLLRELNYDVTHAVNLIVHRYLTELDQLAQRAVDIK